MLLGLVATNENAQVHLLGLASAAKARGWQCRWYPQMCWIWPFANIAGLSTVVARRRLVWSWQANSRTQNWPTYATK
jgi:hypothetical protein